MHRKRPRFSTGNLGTHLLLVLLVVISIFPIYWMVLTSLRAANDLFSVTPLPLPPTLVHYQNVWSAIPLARMLSNTLLMATLVTGAQLLTSILAAYAFARWAFWGSRIIFTLFVATWLVPFQVTMIPNYILLARLGWLNSMAALVVPQLTTAFAVILLRQHMKAFPTELLDAAEMDGANSWRVLWQLMIPNLRAPLAALAILLFISAWNEYFWPILVIRKIENSVIQVGLQMFLTEEGELWGALMAAASLASLPILAIYVVLQRQVIEAFVRSGLK